MRQLVGFICVISLQGGCACGLLCDPADCAEHGLSMVLRADEGAPPPRYQIFLDQPGDGISWTDCGEQERGSGLTCTGDGAFLDDHPEQVGITVKAPGWHHHAASARPEYSERDTSCQECGPLLRSGVLGVDLRALAPFEVNEDYRTGFEAEEGLAAFIAMGFPDARELGPSFTVKFYIEGLDAEPEVYFQDTRRHPLHYNFVRNVLGRPYSLSEYEARTYHGADRPAMAGSLTYFPDLNVPSEALGCRAVAPVVISFFPSDDLTPAQALRAYLLLQERLLFSPLGGNQHRLLYAPAGSSSEAALVDARAPFLAGGALWLLQRELYGDLSLQLLNPGVAYGLLRVMSPEELERSVVSFQDVLLLTRLPNELPIVGGCITEELQTPLAHVNVAARSRGTPNMALRGARGDPRVAPHIGELVRLEVSAGAFSLRAATLEEATAYWDSRAPEEVLVPPADLARAGLLPFEQLGFAHADAVGVKAANVAELWQLMPEHAPHGFALPFSYFDAFLQTQGVSADSCQAAYGDCVEEGRAPWICADARTLCVPPKFQAESFASLADRLMQSPEVAGDSQLREAALNSLRWLMRNTPVDPDFGYALDTALAEELGDDKARLRSSTNAEDLPRFSGAGLYSSTSAYAFGDDRASLRVRRVWASVFNWRAYEERAFWNIDQRAVHMGVLVHRSFPDEQANGVLITQNIADPAARGLYVNVQLGEVAVTNPEEGTLPEVFSVIEAPDGLQLARQRFSTLSPDAPIMTDDEIEALTAAAYRVQHHFAPLYGEDPFRFALELEFKLHGPARQLIVKQVRPYYQRVNP